VIRAYFDGHTATGVEVKTPEELADVLAKVEAAGPWQAAHLIVGDPPGNVLTVGLNGDRGVIRFATSRTEVFSKNATPFPLAEDEEVLYQVGTAEVFFPDDAEVSRDKVYATAREFLESGGEQPSNLAALA
jgi:hypothetical protein